MNLDYFTTCPPTNGKYSIPYLSLGSKTLYEKKKLGHFSFNPVKDFFFKNSKDGCGVGARSLSFFFQNFD